MYSLLLAFFLIAIVFSFLCSLWEAVLLSITPSYAQMMFKQGGATGRRLQEFKENIDRPLVAILSLNTAAHTIGAVGVGAQAAAIWSEANPLITGVAVPIVMTMAILVFSEIIPKTIGANYWQKLARFTVNSMVVVIALLYPLVWLGQWLTQWLKKDKTQPVFSHSEFLAMAEIGVEEGHIQASHPTIIKNLLSLEETVARDVMTPRPVVMSAPEELAIGDYYEANQNLPFSRIVLTRPDDKDTVTGYILKDTMLESLLHGREGEPLKNLKHDIITVPPSFGLPELFNLFIEKREHIALVVNEFGGLDGIITLEDIIETLIGQEIIDETDQNANMREVARKEWEQHRRRHGFLEFEE